MYIVTGITIVLSVLTILVLFKYIYLKRSLGTINIALNEILEGNSNRKFYTGAQQYELKHLVYKLNTLMEMYQNAIYKNKNIEEMRKRMVSDVSHDIRTPLTSIIGYMEALKSDNNLNNEEKNEYTNIVISKCYTLNNLVQSFFEFSRIDEDDVSISLEKVDINSKIRSVMATFYHDFENEGIIPDIMLPEIPIYVFANNMALDRVLQNLISNMMLYGKEGGFFGISVEEDSNRVSVNIWDKGNGITADELKHLFERTYTIKSTNTGKSVISGLGLSIVKRLIEKHNGEIAVSSIPGEKTVFTFSLQKYQ